VKNLFVILIVLILPSVRAEASDLKPPTAETLIEKHYPGSKSLVLTKCEMGSEKIESIGYLIQNKSINGSTHPLVPVIAYKYKQQWSLSEIPKRLESSKGFSPDFLSDFWSTKTGGFKENFKIQCVAPDKDKNISISANGEFSKNFRGGKNGNHICFQADDTYNSWACFNFNPDTKKIESSFSQMNAD
jgi:hypothetical protein